MTYLQARSAGLQVVKGSHGVSIFKGFGKVDDLDDTGKVKTHSAPLGFARVFNLDQTKPVDFEIEVPAEMSGGITSPFEQIVEGLKLREVESGEIPLPAGMSD